MTNSVEKTHRIKERDRKVLELKDFTDAEQTGAPDFSKAYDSELKPYGLEQQP
jgi:hypothetical protein